MNWHSIQVKQELHLDALESPSTTLMYDPSIHELPSPVTFANAIKAIRKRNCPILEIILHRPYIEYSYEIEIV